MKLNIIKIYMKIMKEKKNFMNNKHFNKHNYKVNKLNFNNFIINIIHHVNLFLKIFKIL